MLPSPKLFDKQLFQFIRCPVTKSELSVAPEELITKLNKLIAAGEICNRLNLQIEEPLESGLINADRSLLFPAAGGIPTVIPDEAIPLSEDLFSE